MKHRHLILTTLLAAGLTTAGFATISQAGPFCGDRPGAHAVRTGYHEGRHDPLKRLMRQVDLTDAQQTEIKAIIETSRKDTENARQQLRDSLKTMRKLVAGNDYNLDRVRELADQEARLRADLTVARVDTMHRIQQVLTPEQQAQVAKLREQRMEKWKAWKDEREED
jgi:Spy/CpxP family protein refolding chaperone